MTKPLTPAQLAKKLNDLDMTQDAFAKDIGWSPAYISMVLSGRKKMSDKFAKSVNLYLYKVKNEE